jgi:hypothetical protein
MKEHRSTETRVSNTTEISNFDAGTALENLRAEVIEIEALARAAEEAADELPAATTAHQRLAFGRIQALRNVSTHLRQRVREFSEAFEAAVRAR